MGEMFSEVRQVDEFVLTWTPIDGEPEEVPLARPVTVAGVPGRFTLTRRRASLSGNEAGRIATAIVKATENPGKTFEAGQ